MDGDDFEDEFDIDFVNSASNKVKAKWAKTSIDKDLRDVTNTFEDDNLESKQKKKSKISNFIDNASSDKPLPKTNKIDIINSEASDEDVVPSRKKETSLDVTITPPGSPSNSPPSAEKPTRGSKRTKKTEQALKKIQKSKVRNDLLRSADLSLAQADREIMAQSLRNRHHYVREEEATFELKVRWKAEVFRFEVKQTDRMSKVMEKMAELAGVSINDISIYKDQVSGVPMPKESTVQSQGLSIVSVLHARAKVITVDDDGDTACAPSADGVELKLQTKDRRAQPVTVKIAASDKMEVVIQKYCEETKLEKEKVKFFFDGEQLNPDETAEDLDLEGGECIDVHVIEK